MLATNLEVEKKAHEVDAEVLRDEITKLKEAANQNWRNTLIILVGMFILSSVAIFSFYLRKIQIE